MYICIQIVQCNAIRFKAPRGLEGGDDRERNYVMVLYYIIIRMRKYDIVYVISIRKSEPYDIMLWCHVVLLYYG